MYKVLNNNYIVNGITRVKDTFLHFMNVKQKRVFLSNFLSFFFFFTVEEIEFSKVQLQRDLVKRCGLKKRIGT